MGVTIAGFRSYPDIIVTGCQEANASLEVNASIPADSCNISKVFRLIR